MRTRRQLVIAVISIAVLFSVAVPSALAAERVMLSNGFVMECDHHAQADGRVRLYTSAGETSYIEFKPEEVTSVERIADRPASAAPLSSQFSDASANLKTAELSEVLSSAGRANNLDADLLWSVVKAESSGNVHAVSRVGAKGLMQLMPSTANDLGVQNNFQPDENVRGGSAYLDMLLTKYRENLAMALAAYNAGPAAVDRYHGIPPYHETQAYVARVIHEFNRRVRARKAQERQASNLIAIPHPNGTR